MTNIIERSKKSTAVEMFLDYGDPPEGYAFLPAGDAGMTRRAKQMSEIVLIAREWRGGYPRITGIWSPADVLKAAKEIQQASAERRQKDRERRQNRDFNKARKEIRLQFPSIPAFDLEAVVRRAFTIGNGTVGRAGALDLSEQCRMAVVAHVRHTHTAYDRLMSQGRPDRSMYFDYEDYMWAKDEHRSECRRAVSDDIRNVLEGWEAEP